MPDQPYSPSNCKFSGFRIHISYFNREGGTPKEGSIFRLQADKRVGISLVEKYEGQRNRSSRSEELKGLTDVFFLWLTKSQEDILVWPCIDYLNDGAFTAVNRDAAFLIRYVKRVPFASGRYTI